MNNLTQNTQRKDPWLAVLLSWVFPGAGQIYAEAKARGLFFISLIIAVYVAGVLCIFGFLMAESMQHARAYLIVVPAGMLVLFVVSIYVLFDAYKVTKRRNPDDAQTPAVPGYRKPWLAAFLSAIIPGVGQFYKRQVIKGIALLAAKIIMILFEEKHPLFIILGLLVYLFAIKDAFDSAEVMNGSGNRFFQQRKQIVLFIVIMLSLQQMMPFAWLIKENVLEAYRIPSGGMLPALRIGDHILAGKTRPFFTSVERGDIVVFPYPKDPKKNFIKRVVGLGGDKVQIINGTLYINDMPIPARKLDIQEEADHRSKNPFGQATVYEERNGDAVYRVQYVRDRSTTNGGPWLVPEDAVFVLGDNRDNSLDSRAWGAVPLRTIKGKALKIYWSWDQKVAKVRWERIGETIY